MDAPRDVLRTSQLLAAHAVLAASWIGWRVLESTPQHASAWGGTFASSIAGRGLALVTLLSGVIGLGVVLVRTAQRFGDPRAVGLFAAWIAAVPARGTVDVFDLVYCGTTALIATAWFDRRWRERRLAAGARA